MAKPSKALTPAQRRNAERIIALNKDVPQQSTQPSQPKKVPRPMIAGWTRDPKTLEVTAYQNAKFWHSSGKMAARNSVTCDLCYRNCTIEPGQAGWCRYRVNDGGKMTIPPHGVLSAVIRVQRVYGAIGAEHFRPGARALWLGGTFCTSHCTFCSSMNVAWEPARLTWAYGERRVGQDGGWAMHRAYLHPEGVVAMALSWNTTDLHLGINEPLLSFEFSAQVAQLAKHHELVTSMDTNGFSTPAVVRAISPYIDMVNMGIKGSLDPAFYERWMRAPGATPAVKESIVTWSKSENTFLMISDVVAPPHMQTDEAATEHQKRLYSWIAEEFGELTPLFITGMQRPDPTGTLGGAPLVLSEDEEQETAHFRDRILAAEAIATAAGLKYIRQMSTHTEMPPMLCHSCGGVLFRTKSPMLHCEPCTMGTHFCPFWRHEQHVTDSRCDHCGAEVPFIMLTRDELRDAWGWAETTARKATAERSRIIPFFEGADLVELEPITTDRAIDFARSRFGQDT